MTTLIFELWTDNKVQYMPMEVEWEEGYDLPKQDSIEDRENAVKMLKEHMDMLTVRDTSGEVQTNIQPLDLVGVYHNDVKIWHEGIER